MMKTYFQKLIPRAGRGPGLVTLLAAVLTLTGCLSRPSLNQQTFSFSSPTLTATNFVAGQPVLGIKKLEVASPFEDRPFVYRTGGFNFVRDPYAGFLDRPEEELLTALRADLASQGDFSAVVGTGSALKPDNLVEISVGQLYGDFRQTDHAQAVLTVRFTFFDATNGVATKPIFQKEYSRSIVLGAASGADLMKGWDQALTEILGEVLSDFRQARSGEAAH
ncbi:MAG: ABC-type transport auxiliary lipoprotein family protein [Verrucomicrobiota bacterium]